MYFFLQNMLSIVGLTCWKHSQFKKQFLNVLHMNYTCKT